MKKVIIASGLLVVAGIFFGVRWFGNQNINLTLSNRKPRNVVLLIALPGSGKSEIRRYLSHLDPKVSLKDFGMGSMVEIDDFPYVHLMRRISDECISRGRAGLFFLSPALPFVDPYTWGVLTQLINQDYQDIVNQTVAKPSSAAMWLFDRFDMARTRVGVKPLFKYLDGKWKAELAAAVEADAQKLLDGKNAEVIKAKNLADKTVVIECARGGADSSPMPLPAPLGYQYTLAQLNPGILQQASILYVWVTPEESRRKNEARANPNDPGSILNHCVPRAVMYTDYGCDDIMWLKQQSDKPDTVRIKAHGKTWHIPLGIFDNRADKTTFVRSAKTAWKDRDVTALHGGLKQAFSHR